MSTNEHPLSEEGYQFMAAAFEVHNVLGGGLSEEIYQQSLEIELRIRGIPFCSKHEINVYYKNRELQKRYFPDFIVNDRIIVEIKAISKILTEHEGQLFNYMRVSKSPVGYLVNFGPMDKLTFKRFIISEFLTDQKRLTSNCEDTRNIADKPV
ncbi:MAG: GxxExxY protein [Planctomycetota bacterium]|jgi:GxxExxY protein